jgi:hypothetical protein
MIMDAKKRKRLESAGWHIGDYGDLLGLTETERQIVESRIQQTRANRPQVEMNEPTDEKPAK